MTRKNFQGRKDGSKGGRGHTTSGGWGARKEVGEPAEQRIAGVGGTGRWQGRAQAWPPRLGADTEQAPQLWAASPSRKGKAVRAPNSGGAGWQHHLPTPPDPPSFQA